MGRVTSAMLDVPGRAVAEVPVDPAGGGDPARTSALDGVAARKRELRAFLMNRRARLQPGDVGLPETRRRRTPGLRREEVAALAGLSTAWYTLFEMAKETRVSRKTLDAIARALKLSAAETRHLFVLAGAAGAEPAGSGPEAADPVMQLVLDGFRTGPALLLNDRLDVLATNDVARAIFGDLSGAVGLERNWLWLLFAGETVVENWDDQARELAAVFRGTYCEHAQEPEYNDLLAALLRTSKSFERYWQQHDVQPPDPARPLVLRHPTLGELQFALRTLVLAEHERTRCCFLIPSKETLGSGPYQSLLRVLGAPAETPAGVR